MKGLPTDRRPAHCGLRHACNNRCPTPTGHDQGGETLHALRELLAERGTRSDAEVMEALRQGLAADPAQSGAAATLHALLQRYFALDEDACTRSFASALRRHRDTAQALMAMLSEDGETNVVQLMGSLLEGRPRPSGALAAALGTDGEAASLASRAGGAVKAAFEAFSGAVRKTKDSEAEIELSLAWAAVEGSLLDRVEQHADVLAFAHGPAHRAAAARSKALDELVAGSSIGAMLRALAAAPRPRILARAAEWDIGHAGAPAAEVEVVVQHELHHTPPGPAARLGPAGAARQLAELYAAANGAELFVPLQHEPREAGLRLIPDHEWDGEREHVMTWLTLGGEEPPAWAASLVPIATLPGDASRWVVPLEGPLAGAVLYSNEDVHEEQARYASVAHFIAALRLCPEQVLAVGGYASYAVPDHAFMLYPQRYDEGAEGDGVAGAGPAA